MKCEHSREKSKCRECGGGSFCGHGRIRSVCSICSPELVYKMYQRRAAKRKLRFDLTLNDFINIIAQPCALCGEPGHEPHGIDRKDNNRPYLISNSRSLCWPCNKLKAAWEEREFLDRVLKIARYHDKQRRELQKIHQAPKPAPELVFEHQAGKQTLQETV
jgi:hypothetical protein